MMLRFCILVRRVFLILLASGGTRICCAIGDINFDHFVKVMAYCLAIITIIIIAVEVRIIIVATS